MNPQSTWRAHAKVCPSNHAVHRSGIRGLFRGREGSEAWRRVEADRWDGNRAMGAKEREWGHREGRGEEREKE